jgi:hypothetical protein
MGEPLMEENTVLCAERQDSMLRFAGTNVGPKR